MNNDNERDRPQPRGVVADALEGVALDAQLANAAMSLLHCQREDEVYEVIGEFMTTLCPGAIVNVNEITPDLDFFITRGFFGVDASMLSKAADLMGFEFIGRRWAIPSDFRDVLLHGALTRIPGGFAEVAGHDLPRPVSATLGRVFGLHDLFAIGIADRENALGNIAILTRTPGAILPTHIIESFAHHCFSALASIRKARELAATAELNSLMLRNMSEGLALHEIILDESGEPCDYRFLDCNPAFEALMRLRAEDLIGHTALEVFPEIEPSWIEAYGQVAMTGVPARFEGTSGSLGRRFDVSAYSPQPGQFASILTDITDRAQAQATLAASEAKFAASFRTSPDAVNINRLSDGRYLEINEGFTKLTGFTPDDVAGKTSADIKIWDDLADRELLVQGLRADGVVHNHKARFRRKNGSVRTGLMSARIIEIDGEACILSVTRDISDMEASEQALVESERWLSESQRIAHLGHYIYDIEHDQWDGSPALYEVLGNGEDWSRDFAGWLQIVHEDDRAMLSSHFTDEVLGTRAPFDIEYRIVRPRDGVERWVHGLGTVDFADDGRPLAMFGIIQDITESKHGEELLARSLSSIIAVVGRVVESRDPYTAGHQQRVSELAVAIAEELGLDVQQVDEIRTAALIHDVGKMSIPAEILSKPGRLSLVEFELIKNHSETGHQIISTADMVGPIAEIVYQHHERCDGSGYPRGLKGDEILTAAKIMMVADVVEAMSSHRPYRAALGIEQALSEIERGAGVQYDSDVSEACRKVVEAGFSFSES